MNAKNKIKKIIACFVALIAILATCTMQPVYTAVSYISSVSAKAYKAENKTDPYEFESSGKWSRSTNYSAVTVDSATVNAFEKTTVSQNLATLTFGETSGKTKPATLWNGDTTTVTENADDNKYKVLMIDATNADVKQMKDVTDDEGNVVFVEDAEGNPVYEKVEGTENIKYYEASSINTSDKKFVPAGEEDGTENAGKYKKKVVKQEMTDIYYYYKSNSVSLSKQSYYMISFWVYTSGDAYASVQVASSNEQFNAKVENIQTGDKWQKVYMFMETRADGSASTVYISLYFGNTETINGLNSGNDKVTGTVYFDTVELKTINYTDYTNRTIDGVAPAEENKFIADNYTNRYSYDLIANPHFDTQLENDEWSNYIPEYIDGSTDDKISETTKTKYEQAYEKYSTISIVNEAEELKVYDLDEDGKKQYDDDENALMKNGYSTFKANNKILKIDNDSQLYKIGKTTAPITIGQLMYYRVSVWVKGASDTSSATVLLYGKVKTGNKTEGLLISQTQTVNDIYTDIEDAVKKDDDKETEDKSEMDYNNGWTEVVFYVHGNAYNNIDIRIALLAEIGRVCSPTHFSSVVARHLSFFWVEFMKRLKWVEYSSHRMPCKVR